MGKLVDFNSYYKNYFDKNIQLVFGSNLLAISFSDEDELKVDGIILEQDTMGLIDSPQKRGKANQILDRDIDDWDDFLEASFFENTYVEPGKAYLEDDTQVTSPSYTSPLVVRAVIFDLMSDDDEIYDYKSMVKAYMEAFTILAGKGAKKIRLRPIGIYYSFVPIEESVRAILRALDKYVFEKVFLTVRNREEAEEIWSYIIPFVKRKELFSRRYE